MIKLPKLPNVKGLVALGKASVMAHRPELLFGASITATLASVGLAGKAGYDSGVQVERHENTNGVLLTTKEKAKMTWSNYIPAAVGTLGALGSTTGLHIVHVKEKKQLAAAALMAIEEVRSEGQQYMEQVKEVVDGEGKPSEKVKKIDEIVNSDHEVEDMYLVRDGKTGRDIWSNKLRIDEALIELHNTINGSGECDLNYFYNHAGFPNTKDGFKEGWNGVLPSLDWTESVRDDGRPVRVFDFRPAPQAGYESAH